ncbi:MAG TPA: hypothetical protein VH814_15430 [Steroidobacteraceae bacterium]|jgi:hypothetical protein
MKQLLRVVVTISLLRNGLAYADEVLPTGLGEAVDRDVERVRAATERFKDVDTALAAGYVATDYCVQHPAHGVMGLHFKNMALRDATPDLERPEILLYQRLPDGTLRLNGVEYVVPLSAWMHDEPPLLLGQKMRREENQAIWYLHAWIWEWNPSGIFADWNPRAKC